MKQATRWTIAILLIWPMLSGCASDEQYFADSRAAAEAQAGAAGDASAAARPAEVDEDVPEVASIDAAPGPDESCGEFVIANHRGAEGKKAPELIAEARAAGVETSRLVPIGAPAKDAQSVPGRLSIMVYGTDEVVGLYCG